MRVTEEIDIYVGDGIQCKRCGQLFVSKFCNTICKPCIEEMQEIVKDEK